MPLLLVYEITFPLFSFNTVPLTSILTKLKIFMAVPALFIITTPISLLCCSFEYIPFMFSPYAYPFLMVPLFVLTPKDKQSDP